MTFPRVTPAAAGVASHGIQAFIDAAADEGHELHSLMIERHRSVVAEGWWAPYARETPHQLHSLSKIILSAAVGVAVGEGLFRVQDRVIDLLPDDVPDTLDGHLAEMRVFHLLTGSTGQRPEDAWDPDATRLPDYDRVFLALPVPEVPGTRFHYNPRASLLLASIVEVASGERLAAYLRDRLFAPLGIREPPWTGFGPHQFAFAVRTQDLLSLGRLFLDGGVAQGGRILPSSYVAEAIAPQVSTAHLGTEGDSGHGYGYQFWRHRNGAYGVNGAFGQYVTIFPDHDVVVAITGETSDMQGVYDLMWEHLVPAFDSGVTPDEDEELAARMRNLRLPGPIGGPHADRGTGTDREYVIRPNDLGVETLRVITDDAGCRMVFRHPAGETSISHGWGTWVAGVSTLPGAPVQVYPVPELHPAPVAGLAAWAGDVLTARWQYLETAHSHVVEVDLAGDRLELRATPSATWDGTPFERPTFGASGAFHLSGRALSREPSK